MNIECPNCHAAYDVPDSRLGARRLLRCGTCSHAWGMNDDAATMDIPLVPEPDGLPNGYMAILQDAQPALAVAAAGDRLSPPRLAAPRDVLLNGAWVVSALVIVGAATAAFAWRDDITAAWPPAARVLGTAARAAMVAQAPDAPAPGAQVPMAQAIIAQANVPSTTSPGPHTASPARHD